MAVFDASLSRKQQRAVAALVSEPTVGAAARVAGVGETTLHRWLRQPEFAEALRAARNEAFGAALASVQQAAVEAVQTLRGVMADPDTPPSSRVAAARSVLDIALKAHDLQEIEERLAALEEKLGEGDGQLRAA